MANDRLNLVLFGQPGTQLSELARALRPLRPRDVRVAATFEGLAQQLHVGAPDCAILCITVEQEASPAYLDRVRDIVAHAGTPCVVALDRELGAAPMTAFDIVLGMPYESVALERIIGVALAGSAGAAAQGAPGASSQKAPRAVPERAAKAADPDDAEDEEGGDPLDDSAIEVRSWTSRAYRAAPADEEDVGSRLAPPRAVTDTDPALHVRRWESGHSDRATSGDQARVLDRELSGERDAAPDALRIELPPLSAGDLSRFSPMRVLFAHAVKQSSGHLVLEMGGIRRVLALHEGEPGLDDVPEIDQALRTKVVDSLLWSQGTYRFEEAHVRAARFRSLGGVLEVLHTVVRDRLSLSQVTEPLTPLFTKVPVPTELSVAESGRLGKLPGMTELIRACDGRTLEQVIGAAGGAFEQVLRSAYFGELTGMLSFEDRPQASRRSVAFMTARRPRDAPKAKPAPSPPAAPNDEALLEELAERAAALQSQDPYEVFDLQPGCGRRVLQTRYYQLVRKHHPDAYGLARAPEVKPLAEMVFRYVQKAYTELTKLETSEEPQLRPEAAPWPEAQASAQAQAEDEPVVAGAETSTPPDLSSIATQPRVPVFRRQPTDAASAPAATILRTHPRRPALQRPARPAAAPVADGDEAVDTERQVPVFRRAPSLAESGTASAEPPAAEADPGEATPPPRDLAEARPDEAKVGTTASGQWLRVTPPPVTAAAAGPVPSEPAPSALGELSPEQLFRHGLNLLRTGANERAHEAFEQALAGKPKSPVYAAHLAWALYLMDKGKAEEAKAALRGLLRAGDEVEFPALFLGRLYESEGAVEEAVDLYKRCLTVNPRNVEALRQLRLYRMRTERSRGGRLFDRLFSKGKGPKKST